MTSIKYIVARYNEDISWILYNIPIENIVVYNKYQNLGIPNEKLIANVGREAETYLHYIIDNYDDLPDICVFTQGRIHDHIGMRPDLHNFLIECGTSAIENGYSNKYFDKFKQDEINWGKNWNVNFGVYWLQALYKDSIQIPFSEWFKQHICAEGEEYPELLHAFPNALFGMSKKQILSRPKEYYENLITLVNWAPNCIEAHFFERSWFYIFNCHKL